MANDLDFINELPEPKNGRKGKVPEFVEMLKTRPSEWALYGTFKKWGNQSNYRKRFPGTEWSVRTNDEGRTVVYARWIGEANNA